MAAQIVISRLKVSPEELIIRLDHEELQDSDGEFDGEYENQTWRRIHARWARAEAKGSTESDGGNLKNAESSRLLSLQWCRPSQQQQGPNWLISLGLICKKA